MHNTATRRVAPALAAIGALSIVLAGCADVPSDSGTSAPDTGLPAALVQAAVDRATEIVDGQDLDGTTVSFISTLGGAERERFLSTIAPFEEATGITLEFTGSEDMTNLVQVAIDSGTPYDVTGISLGSLVQYAESGDAIDLNELVGADVLADQFAPGFIDATTFDGGTYGIWTSVDNFELWYNPATYDGPTSPDLTWDELSTWAAESAASGTPPWCMGVSTGATTGWPAAWFMLHVLTKQSGPDTVNALGTGALSWDSPEVRNAFELLGAMVADDTTVQGGPNGVLSVDPGVAHAGMYTDPTGCVFEPWGTWTASIIQAGDPSIEPGTDLDFLRIPAMSEEFAGVEGYTGNIVSAYSDRPEVAALMTYFASSEFANLMASTGNWVPANANVDASVFPNDILRKVSTDVIGAADELVLVMPPSLTPEVEAKFYSTIAEFIGDQSTLDGNLAELDTLPKG